MHVAKFKSYDSSEFSNNLILNVFIIIVIMKFISIFAFFFSVYKLAVLLLVQVSIVLRKISVHTHCFTVLRILYIYIYIYKTALLYNNKKENHRVTYSGQWSKKIQHRFANGIVTLHFSTYRNCKNKKVNNIQL